MIRIISATRIHPLEFAVTASSNPALGTATVDGTRLRFTPSCPATGTTDLSLLVTDLAIWEPDPVTKEFTVNSMHPGVTRDDVQATCGWPARFKDPVDETPPPTALELGTLRDLKARTEIAHRGGAG